MALFIILLIVDVTVGIIYAKAGYPKVTMPAFWYKMLGSGIFVAYGVYAYIISNKSAYGKLIVTALILGLIGDALLSFEPFIKENDSFKRNNTIFTVIGAAAFLAGHIFYIIAFVQELMAKDAFNLKIFLISWVIIIAVALTVKTLLKARLGKLAAPMAVYALGISAMGAISISLSICGFSGNLLAQIVFIVAPLLFMTSDATLALKFSGDKRFGGLKLRLATLITYYAAQMLFGFTTTLT